MEANVTQNLLVRIVPVNNPNKFNEYDEQMGYYSAYVATDEHQIDVAQSEWQRGIVHNGAGYGSGAIPRLAVMSALDDYIDKFGALCVYYTND